MFTTFGISTPDSSTGRKTSPQPRPRRAQVSRACDGCRLSRVKCDAVRPCRNCKQARRECVSGRRDDFKSVAAATREVQRLRAQVEELEAKLLQSPSVKNNQVFDRRKREPRWKGVWSDGLYYGSSSLTYFVHRLSSFISLDIKPGFPEDNRPLLPPESPPACDKLDRMQQDAFLDLFWQGYHVIYPALDEGCFQLDTNLEFSQYSNITSNLTPEFDSNIDPDLGPNLSPQPHHQLHQNLHFRQHYESLWEDSSFRRACPLVDIVLALCIQSESTYISHQPNPAENPRLLGNDFFSRTQHYLLHTVGSPSLISVQCYFFSALYLRAAGKLESAYQMVGNAVRMAQSLGMELAGLRANTGDHRLTWTETKLWSSLSALDVSLSLDLGRSPSSHYTSSTVPEPNDMAILMGQIFRLEPSLGINWLSFETERHKLVILGHEIHEELTAVCDKFLEEIDQDHFYSHPLPRERCASFLLQQLEKLRKWVREVPEGLKTPRQQGVTFSVDRSPLDFSGNAPLWLQRQRLILELEYHNLCILLCRRFITFSPTPTLGTLSSDNHCIMCVNHAIAATNIMNQVLKDTDILVGWHQIRDWQANAMFALAGFASGYPMCPATPSSRKALAASAAVFESIGSPEMASLARRLDDKVAEIIKSFALRLGISTLTVAPPLPDPASETHSTAASLTGLEPGMPKDSTNSGVMGLGYLDKGDDPPVSWLWGDFIQDFDDGLSPTDEMVRRRLR